MNATYLVPERNLAELETRIEKLNKRAVRLGVPPITVEKHVDHVKARCRVLTVDGHINHVWELPERIAERNAKWHCEDTGERQAWWSVTVNGETPTLNGWTFVAVLEPLELEDGSKENFVRALPGETCPVEFRERVNECDHCHTIRRRTETFVVRSETEGHKCVGRQCLKDFLGYHANPHALAKWAETLAQLAAMCGEAEDEDFWGIGGSGYRPDCWDLKRFLTLTATRVRLFGWVSRAKARDDYGSYATADAVLRLMTPPWSGAGEKEKEEWKKFCESHVETAKDGTDAEAAVEWAKDLEPGDNDYLANCHLVGRVGTVSRKTAGVAASILTAYYKEVEREFERARRAALPPSEWVGEKGKRLQVLTVKVEKIIAHEGAYGVTMIHKMTDEHGNDLVWFASAGASLGEGNTATVSATVKDHSEYNGRKQTVLTRVTVWTPEGLAANKAKEEKKAARAVKKAEREAKKAAKEAAKLTKENGSAA